MSRASRAAPSICVDGYVRVSRVGKRRGPSFISPTVQREAIEEWSARQGFRLLEVFEELDESGARADRPLLEQAVRRIELGASSALVVWRVLAHPYALAAQLRAVAATRGSADVRILLPLAESGEQVVAVRAGFAALGGGAAIGAMIETPAAVGAAAELAAVSAFLSIGTNDLAHATVGADRFAGVRAEAFDPRVLALIRQTVEAAHGAGIPVEVCGEAASDPVAMPLLVGVGVDELSVGAARVPTVRRWVRTLERCRVAELATRALASPTAEAVRALVEDALGDALGEERART